VAHDLSHSREVPTVAISVLSVVSELYPLIKTGGLADVAGALPGALAPLGVQVTSLMPAYPGLTGRLQDAREVMRFADLMGFPARLVGGRGPDGQALLLLDAPELYDRPGGPYADPAGRDWSDNPRRFAALCWVAREIGLGHTPLPAPDIVHSHDWQAGLAPAYLALSGEPRPKTVLTIHNLAFQGLCDPMLMDMLRLPWSSFSIEGVEYFGSVSFLKAGLYYADRLTTVSPTYAREIRTAEGGMGLGGLLASRAGDLVGIINGIDTGIWDPAADPLLPTGFTAQHLSGKAKLKAALRQRLGLLQEAAGPLVVVVSRLSHQKGLDLVLACLPQLLEQDGQLAVLGTGDPVLEAGFIQAAQDHPGRVAFVGTYDENLAHLFQAGGDAILVPSRFEPCGLTQLCALRYGTLPVVARVGGLADTVIDANPAALATGVATGFTFAPPITTSLGEALWQMGQVWQDQPAWHAMQRNAMRSPVGWKTAAGHYLALYLGLLGAGPAEAGRETGEV
jgi:starch synthase